MTGILNKNQTEILEVKNSINEIKNALECIGNRTDQMEERIHKVEDRHLEMIQAEEERKQIFKKQRNPIRGLRVH